MAPTRDYYTSFLLLCVVIAMAGHCQVPEVVATQCFTHFAFESEFFTLFMFKYAINIRIQFRLGLRVAMTEKYFIIVILKRLSEC